MFDISFSELMLIGVIALIVIGPERLPKVARTVGHLLGRAQRYVNDVKTDIRKEMDASEISNLKDQMQQAATSVKASVNDASKAWQAPFDEAQDALKQASESVKTLADSAARLHADTPETGEPKAAEAGESALDAAATDAASSTAPEDLEGAETIDTQTLPLPGFEHEHALQDSTATQSPNANKGSQ